MEGINFISSGSGLVLTLRSWLVGAWIVEYEQHGEDRAAYGEGLIERLSDGWSAWDRAIGTRVVARRF